jgi:hypothetical protein
MKVKLETEAALETLKKRMGSSNLYNKQTVLMLASGGGTVSS